MDRRKFLGAFAVGIAGLALDQAIPFGRVWSFPSKIVVPETGELGRAAGFEWDETINVGSFTPIRIPQRFEIGDIVTIGDWPGRFVVSRVHPNKTVELYSAEQRLIRRGVPDSKLTPFLIGQILGQT